MTYGRQTARDEPGGSAALQGRSAWSPRRRLGRCHPGLASIRVKVVGMAVVSVADWFIVIPFFTSSVVGGVRPAPIRRCHPEVSLNDLSQYLPMLSSDLLACQVVEHVCGELVTGIGGTGLALQERPQLLDGSWRPDHPAPVVS